MTELLTNGAFTTNLAGWTSVQNAAQEPGQGDLSGAGGQLGWSATVNGCALFVVGLAQVNSGFDGALKQSLGTLTPGNTYVLEIDLQVEIQTVLTGQETLRAQVWIQGPSGLPHVAMVISNQTFHQIPEDPAVAAFTVQLAADVPVRNDYTADVSHFVREAGTHTLWISAFLNNGPAAPAHRVVAQFGLVSFDDVGAPPVGADIATTPMRVQVDESESMSLRI